MRALRLFVSVILLQVLVVAGFAAPCSAQGVSAPQLEGLWQSEAGQQERWVDIRVWSARATCSSTPGGRAAHPMRAGTSASCGGTGAAESS